MSTGNNKSIFFNVAGGAGKNIAATAVVRAIQKAYPHHEIVVGTAHPFVWDNNPRIRKAVSHASEPYIYRDYLKDASILLIHDPYLESDFLYKRRHVIEIWCSLFNIPSDGLDPELYVSEQEKKEMEALLPAVSPVFLMQTNGGAPSQFAPISWTRDLPLQTAQRVADSMREKGYKVFHLRREDQPRLENVERLNVSTRQALVAISMSHKRLLIDSLAQHAAAAFGLPSVVCWTTDSSKTLGYPLHNNIISKAENAFRHYPEAFLEPHDITGLLHECPYDSDQLFDADELLKALE